MTQTYHFYRIYSRAILFPCRMNSGIIVGKIATITQELQCRFPITMESIEKNGQYLSDVIIDNKAMTR